MTILLTNTSLFLITAGLSLTACTSSERNTQPAPATETSASAGSGGADQSGAAPETPSGGTSGSSSGGTSGSSAGGGGGANSVSPFVGRWDHVSGERTTSCSGQPARTDPPKGDHFDIAMDADGLKAIPAEGVDCSYRLVESEKKAEAKPGQSCVVESDQLKEPAKVTVSSWTLTLTDEDTGTLTAKLGVEIGPVICELSDSIQVQRGD